jgi:hypothetical protein
MDRTMAKSWNWALVCIVFSAGVVFPQESVFKNFTWLFGCGIKHASIVGRNRVDGVSGATKTLWNASAGTEIKIKGHYIETGFSFGQTDQHITYHPSALNPDLTATGERNISLLLLDIPVLYNFHFLPSTTHPESGRLIAGIGAFASCVLSKQIESIGAVSSEKLSGMALGPLFRLSYFPLDLPRIRPGLYFDFCRSFFPKNFYDDPYFKQNGIAGQLGTINAGICFRIR